MFIRSGLFHARHTGDMRKAAAEVPCDGMALHRRAIGSILAGYFTDRHFWGHASLEGETDTNGESPRVRGGDKVVGGENACIA
jgi:hypothetical protein